MTGSRSPPGPVGGAYSPLGKGEGKEQEGETEEKAKRKEERKK